MTRKPDIYSVEYYLPQAAEHANEKAVLQKFSANQNFKILVQDHIKDSFYLIDA